MATMTATLDIPTKQASFHTVGRQSEQSQVDMADRRAKLSQVDMADRRAKLSQVDMSDRRAQKFSLHSIAKLHSVARQAKEKLLRSARRPTRQSQVQVADYSNKQVTCYSGQPLSDTQALLARLARYNLARTQTAPLRDVIELRRQKDAVAERETIGLDFNRKNQGELRARRIVIEEKQAKFRAEVKSFNEQLLEDVEMGKCFQALMRSEILATQLMANKIKQLQELQALYEEYLEGLKELVQRYAPYSNFMDKCTVAAVMNSPFDLIKRYQSLISVWKENTEERHMAIFKRDLVKTELRTLRKRREENLLQLDEVQWQLQQRLARQKQENKQQEHKFDDMMKNATTSVLAQFRVEMAIRHLYNKVTSRYSKEYQETDTPLEQLDVVKSCAGRLLDVCNHVAKKRKKEILDHVARTRRKASHFSVKASPGREQREHREQRGRATRVDSGIDLSDEDLLLTKKHSSYNKHRSKESNDLTEGLTPPTTKARKLWNIGGQKTAAMYRRPTIQVQAYMNTGLLLPSINRNRRDVRDKKLSQVVTHVGYKFDKIRERMKSNANQSNVDHGLLAARSECRNNVVQLDTIPFHLTLRKYSKKK